MRKRTGAVLTALAVALALVSGGSPNASVFIKEDVGSLKKASEAVVHARVVDIDSYWNPEHSLIFTEVRLEVRGRLHGASDDQLVVRVPGGTVGDYTIEMEGAPRFAMDEEVVAFIARWHDGVPMVAGYFQGLARVERDSLGNAFLRGGVADGLPMSELARMLRQPGR